MQNNHSSFYRRLRTGGLAGTLGAISAAHLPCLTSANAAVIYSGIQNLSPVHSGRASPGQQFTAPVNIDHSGAAEMTVIETFVGNLPPSGIFDGGPVFTNHIEFGTLAQGLRNPFSGELSRLFAGTMIGSGNMGQGGSNLISGRTDVDLGDFYFGFRFYPSTESPAVYGWGHMQASSAGLRLVDWAYEDSGASILAGQMQTVVPEPGTALSFSFACLTAAGLRRKRTPPTNSGA